MSSITEFEYTVSDEWQVLTEDDRQSDVSHFRGGFRCIVPTGAHSHGDEVLIWETDSDSAENPYFENVTDERISPGDRYLVTYKTSIGSEPNIRELRETLEEAVQTASDMTRWGQKEFESRLNRSL